MSSSSAITLVQRIIREHGPLTSKEIYRLSKQAAAPSVLKTSHPTTRSDSASPHSASTPASPPLVPSMSSLRKHILPEIRRTGEFEQIHSPRSSSATSQLSSPESQTSSTSPKQKGGIAPSSVWRVTPAERLAGLRQDVEEMERRRNPPDPLVYDAEKGVVSLTGAPYLEHLNKRRRRARVQKLQRERELVKQVAKSRLEKPIEQSYAQ